MKNSFSKNEQSVRSNCCMILQGFNDVSALISVLPLLTKRISKTANKFQ
jgi:hypothetical protein